MTQCRNEKICKIPHFQSVYILSMAIATNLNIILQVTKADENKTNRLIMVHSYEIVLAT